MNAGALPEFPKKKKAGQKGKRKPEAVVREAEVVSMIIISCALITTNSCFVKGIQTWPVFRRVLLMNIDSFVCLGLV